MRSFYESHFMGALQREPPCTEPCNSRPSITPFRIPLSKASNEGPLIHLRGGPFNENPPMKFPNEIPRRKVIEKTNENPPMDILAKLSS
jgi:hypothetical protein